ncbi:MAG TPA: PD-(D/E)XK nuclease family protein, partial [Opitutales bacterium]|nr:PD-(D/E)XK nuclease family protein [Opitutales bacterium]
DPGHFQAVFLSLPEQSPGWRQGMAQGLTQLRDELGEEGLSVSEAAEVAAASGFESERWRQLARLEALYLQALQARQLKDPNRARKEAADQYMPPAGIERILLVATPDAQALPLKAIAKAAAQLPVEIWNYGPEELFDSWGRPLEEIWSRRALDFEAWGVRIYAYNESGDLVRKLAAAAKGREPESILLGLADRELTQAVAGELERMKTPGYDPEGVPLHLHRLGRLTELLCQLSRDADTATVRSLLQHPDLFQWLQSSNSQKHLLRKLDESFQNHLCADLPALIHFAEDPRLKGALKAIHSLKLHIRQAPRFSEGLGTALQTIYADYELAGDESSKLWREQAEAVRTLLSDISSAEADFASLKPELAGSLVLQSLRRSKVYPDRPRDAHDLLGWLELLWNDAPQLMLAGINEGKVPESVVGDAFLPDNLREVLGLRTNARRFARDAYLLEALCRRRAAEKGDIQILVAQQDGDGTPLKPSRLLFLGEPETLLPRTRKLFSGTETAAARSRHTIPWKLRPPPGLPMPERISVSALRTYLECPFRFFLRHIMGMRPVDVETREMNPASFGSLTHEILSKLKGSKVNPQTNSGELSAKLHAIAKAEFTHKFGDKLSFALRLQEEAILARIQAFVDRQIEDVQTHGRIEIIDTELKFNLDFEGLTLRGVIDRIDQRGDKRELIDYKTADAPKTPDKAHLAVVARKEPPAHLPDEAFFDHGDRRFRWTDLQLPLYLLAQSQHAGTRPGIAYFNLAKTLEKSEIARWEEFSQSHLDSARNCAGAVIRKIKSGAFWPPNPDVREDYDDFAPLFPDGIENSVEAEAFANYKFHPRKDPD